MNAVQSDSAGKFELVRYVLFHPLSTPDFEPSAQLIKCVMLHIIQFSAGKTRNLLLFTRGNEDNVHIILKAIKMQLLADNLIQLQ